MTRFLAAAIVAFSSCAYADTVFLASGGKIDGTVLQSNPDRVVVMVGKGTITLQGSHVKKIERTATKADPVSSDKALPALSNLETVVSSTASQAWATDFSQIAATVIDVGVLKNVPYKSYRCGTDYELNVYGDPDQPACIEIGVYRSLIASTEAKEHCRTLVGSLLGSDVDSKLLKQLNLEEDKVVRGKLTIEITPPTAEDAYGGWWVSVYDQELLDKARASDKEVESISEPRISVIPSPSSIKTQPATKSPSRQNPSYANDDIVKLIDTYTPEEMARSRAPRASSGQSSASSSGRVYVRGYYRKDGTYVRPHSRSR
jgi:hypothetical protein